MGSPGRRTEGCKIHATGTLAIALLVLLALTLPALLVLGEEVDASEGSAPVTIAVKVVRTIMVTADGQVSNTPVSVSESGGHVTYTAP